MNGNYLENGIKTIIDLTQFHAEKYAENILYTYLNNGEEEGISLSYKELNLRAKSIAAKIQTKTSVGDRALVLFPNNLEFIVAFFGCIYAGVIAVPVQMPQTRRADLSHLSNIANDADINLIITETECFTRFSMLAGSKQIIRNKKLLFTDKVDYKTHDCWSKPSVSADNIAFLQYTSGSTGFPKGVMVTHANLLHNQKLIKTAFGNNEGNTIVGWLPLFHDMGLIGNVIQPLFIGGRLVLMSPTAFLQKPVRWLNAISRYRAETSGGPNFSYDLCVGRITEEQKKALDLSHWTNAFNGAERVNYETLEKFYQAFKSCGFKKESFYPTYGLAEGTLFVSGGKRSAALNRFTASSKSIESGKIKTSSADEKNETFVSSGKICVDQKVLVVNPKNHVICQENEVGEIWLKGPSVTKGYWRNEEKTKEFYQVFLNSGEGPFFRTGDLGFVSDRNLYVTGRLKDLIIIRGRNIYPDDIEFTAQSTNQIFRKGCGASFSVQENDQEKIVLLQEVDRRILKKLNYKEETKKLNVILVYQFKVQFREIVLLPPGIVPRTTSGKIRRKKSKQLYEAGSFDQFKLDNSIKSHVKNQEVYA